MSRESIKGWKQASWQFWLLTAFLCLIFLTGGSSRGDVQSLSILRPVSVVILGIGFATLNWDDIKRYRTLVIFALLIVALVGLYLIPLPQVLIQLFPAFDTIEMVGKLSPQAESVHRAAVVPPQAWNGFYSLFIPLSVLSLVIQLKREDLFRLMIPLLGLGFISGLFGFLQILGSADGSLYFYRITNNGNAVGLFANRNHQAILLTMLFPMLAIFASSGIKSVEQMMFRGWIAVAGGVFLIPLILVTGSRAGLVFGILALIVALVIYRKPEGLAPPKRKGRNIDWRVPLAGLGVVALGLISILLSRAQALDRLISGENAQDGRLQFWDPIAQMAKHDLPFGTGPGSIAETYASIEPLGLLEGTYLNRAHNDWLETFSSFGLLGIVLLIAAIVAVMAHGRSVFAKKNSASRQTFYSKLGFTMIALAAMGSVVDYPIRTPIMSAVLVIAMVWFVFPPRSNDTASTLQSA